MNEDKRVARYVEKKKLDLAGEDTENMNGQNEVLVRMK